MKHKPRKFWWNFNNLVKTTKGINTFRKWCQNYPGGSDYLYAHPEVRKKFIKHCFSGPFQTRGPWDYNKLRLEAQKYSSIKEWFKKNKSSLNYFYKSKKQGLISQREADKICRHMKKYSQKRSLKECLASAQKFNSKIDWRITEPKFYKFAFNRPKWFKQCTKHMPKIKSPNCKEVNEVQPEFVQMFNKKFLGLYKAIIFTKNNLEEHGMVLKKYNKKPDCVIFDELLKQIYFIEIKTDTSHCSGKRIKDQIKEYNKIGKNNFQDSFKGTMVSCPLKLKNRKNIKMLSFKELFNLFERKNQSP